MTEHDCRICRNVEGNETFTAREMMFGTRDAFAYVRCGACGCVHIACVPEDLGRYYPADYYAYAPPRREGRARALLQRLRADHLLGRPNPVGWFITRRRGVPQAIAYVRRAGLRREHSILDVGCGTGALLLGMRSYGFRDLTGIDPFVERDIDYGNGVRVWKRELEDHEGRHDLVMLHHTFEHMESPQTVLARIRALLTPGGTALLRMPVASSTAFEIYRADWVQLDAPRHLYLHTPRSVSLLAQAAGLKIVDVVYDSTAFQFWGSEQYRRDIPLRDPRSYLMNPDASPFTRTEIEVFEARARQLNAEGRGDQAAFYLRAGVDPS
jgi:SAM-dependent methyltransferase